jgi:ribosomal-protein-alanine N-acetyltransferase
MARPPIPHPVLTTPRLRLRQFRAEDTDAMRFWNREVHTKRIETERAVRRFIDCTPSHYRFWAVADGPTDRCLGLVNYHDGHIRSRRASIGYMINPGRHREGLATEAVSAMLDFIFGTLRLHRGQAFIHPANAASLALVEKLGFRREGLLRDHPRVGEVWRDDVV